jgi:MerR family transcriptional regulator, heat shock protein HspR
MDSGAGRTNEVDYHLTVAAQLVGLPPARVRRYLEVGLVRARTDERGAPLLGTAELARLRKIRRLTSDLGLNLAGVEVALRLLDEIEALQTGGESSRPAKGDRVFGLLGDGTMIRRERR